MKASVPVSEQPAETTSAASGEATAMIPAARSGPAVNKASSATESIANAVGNSGSRPWSRPVHIARRAPPTLGTATPPTSPQATSASVGAPVSVSAISRPVAVTSTTAATTSTRR